MLSTSDLALWNAASALSICAFEIAPAVTLFMRSKFTFASTRRASAPASCFSVCA